MKDKSFLQFWEDGYHEGYLDGKRKQEKRDVKIVEIVRDSRGKNFDPDYIQACDDIIDVLMNYEKL